MSIRSRATSTLALLALVTIASLSPLAACSSAGGSGASAGGVEALINADTGFQYRMVLKAPKGEPPTCADSSPIVREGYAAATSFAGDAMTFCSLDVTPKGTEAGMREERHGHAVEVPQYQRVITKILSTEASPAEPGVTDVAFTYDAVPLEKMASVLGSGALAQRRTGTGHARLITENGRQRVLRVNVQLD